MHKHRFIILRRLALILGLLYGYRAITMFVTNLPKADPNYFCTAKVSHVSISNPIEMHYKKYFIILLKHVYLIFTGI